MKEREREGEVEIEWRCCSLVQLCNFHFEVFTTSRETKRDEREAEGVRGVGERQSELKLK